MSSAEAVARAIASMIDGDYRAAWSEIGSPDADDRSIGAGLSLLLAELPAEIAEKLEVGALRYDLGVWLKRRACFDAALAALLAARATLPDEEALSWNIAIAATGAADGRAASDAWKRLGLEVTRGSDSLPRVQGLADVRVRLADGIDVRVRPRSPIHGVVLSVRTEHELPASYADVILWDAAPLEVEGEHVFPFLARLELGGARLAPFTSRGDLRAFSSGWPDALWLSFDGDERGVLVIEPDLSVDEARAEIARTRALHPEVFFEVDLPS